MAEAMGEPEKKAKKEEVKDLYYYKEGSLIVRFFMKTNLSLRIVCFAWHHKKKHMIVACLEFQFLCRYHLDRWIDRPFCILIIQELSNVMLEEIILLRWIIMILEEP